MPCLIGVCMVFLVLHLYNVKGLNMEKRIRVADEIWIAAASLHRDHPDRADFTIGEIMARAESANVTGVKPLRPESRCMPTFTALPTGLRIQAGIACSSKRRMGAAACSRSGDPCHPLRAAGKDMPKRHEIPSGFRDLIDWYVGEYAGGASDDPEDPVLSLRGLGAEIWADEDADAYVRRQRSGWQ